MLDGDAKSSSRRALPLPSSKASRRLDSERDSSRRDDKNLASTINNHSLSRDESGSPNNTALSSDSILKRASSASAHLVTDACRAHNSSRTAPAPRSLPSKTQSDTEKLSTMLCRPYFRISASQGTPTSSSTGKTKPRPDESQPFQRSNGQGSKCTPRAPVDGQSGKLSGRPGLRSSAPKTVTSSTEDSKEAPKPTANGGKPGRGCFERPIPRLPTNMHSSFPDAQLHVAVFQRWPGLEAEMWMLFLDRNGSGDLLSDIACDARGHWIYREQGGVRPERLFGHHRNVHVGPISSWMIPGYRFELSHRPISPWVPSCMPHIWVLDVLERLEAVHMIADCSVAMAELLDQNSMPAILGWMLRPNQITAGPNPST
jgi:hypothetical protein